MAGKTKKVAAARGAGGDGGAGATPSPVLPARGGDIHRSELARRTLARRRLLYFTKQTQLNYQAGWVHDDICRRLEQFSQDVVARRSPRLMLLVPPRHGKSTLASVSFPAWHLGQHPEHEIVNASYNLDLPMKFSRQVRDLFRSPFYHAIFPDAVLSPESQSVESWLTTRGGGFTAVGVGGGLTGKGAHVMTVDDPLKNMEEADSQLIRDQLFDWYQSVAYTRLAPGGGVLLIETWWHDDDLAGRLQRLMAGGTELADQFDVVKYPALAEEYEYRSSTTLSIVRSPTPLEFAADGQTDLELLRSPGEALHPDRYDAAALMRYRANLAPRIWSALYQQNPVPDSGQYFREEYFRTESVSPAPYERNVYTAWDFAIGEKTMNDWTVGATMIQDENDTLHVAEVVRFRGDSFTIVENMFDVMQRWSGMNISYTLGVEDGQIWRAIKPLFEKRMSERRMYPVMEVMKPLTDKVARARPLQGRMQQKKVVFLEGADWLANAKHEMLRFPSGQFDDVVDALAWCTRLASKPPPQPRGKPARPKSWKDRLAGIQGGDVSHMAA